MHYNGRAGSKFAYGSRGAMKDIYGKIFDRDINRDTEYS